MKPTVVLLTLVAILGSASSTDACWRRSLRRQHTCPCAERQHASRTAGCSVDVSASLRDIRLDGQNIKGSIYAKIYAKCVGTTIIDFDGKLGDFSVGKDGASIERDFRVACARMHLKIYSRDASEVCVHWDVTGCSFDIPLDGTFELDEHGEKCFPIP